MSRVSRWAEKYFSLRCSHDGAICTPPDEDTNGWDFLVEFPEKEYAGPVESRPPVQVGYAQIKSTRSGNLRAKVKLSNMLKAARSRDPWFIFMIADKAQCADPIVYGVHIWSELIKKSLAAVRKASLDGTPLNKRTLTVPFPPDSKIEGDLIGWMLQQIDAVSEDYGTKKHDISESVGYESGHGTGNLKVVAASEDEIVRGFLGLGNGLTIAQFAYTPSRFGLPDPKPQISAEDGTVRISPDPIDTCEIRVRGPEEDPCLQVDGKVYAFAPPGTLKDKGTLRLSAPPIEIVHKASGKSQIDIMLDTGDRYSLSYLEAYAKIRHWLSLGDVDLQAWSKGKCFYAGKLSANISADMPDIRSLASFIECLQRTAQKRDLSGLTVSVDEMSNSISDLSLFQQALAEAKMQVTFDDPSELPPSMTSFLYHTGVTVGEWSFACVVKRQVTNDNVDDGVRTITADKPKLLELYVQQDAIENQRELIESDYNRFMQALGAKEEVLCFGDFHQHIRQQNRPA